MPHLLPMLPIAIAALAVVAPAFAQGAGDSDRERLVALNLDYVRSVQAGDVARFREILADDFRASMPDGTLLDKTAFLALTARPVTISGLTCHDVELRILGDIAIVHARTTYTTAEGRPATGRYTDVWARRRGTWLAVAAHVTRTP
jgi:ketosteroid isomerase-like protein